MRRIEVEVAAVELLETIAAAARTDQQLDASHPAYATLLSGRVACTEELLMRAAGSSSATAAAAAALADELAAAAGGEPERLATTAADGGYAAVLSCATRLVAQLAPLFAVPAPAAG